MSEQTKESLESKAQEIAHQLSSYLQDACGDIAYEASRPGSGYGYEAKIRKARKAGVRDIPGWLADELYNDADSIEDLLGDRLYDETPGDKDLRNAVLDCLAKSAHPALTTAVNNLRRDWL
jgi:hypothetical protein